MPFVYTDLFVSTDLGQSNPLVTTPRRVYVLRRRSRCRVLSTAITVSHRLSSRPLNFPLTHSLFVGECKVSGTTFFTPRAAWSLPRFQLVRLASVSIATVQASIPQSGPRLRFGATPLVPCPFAFQPNLDSVRCVAEQTLTRADRFVKDQDLDKAITTVLKTFCAKCRAKGYNCNCVCSTDVLAFLPTRFGKSLLF